MHLVVLLFASALSVGTLALDNGLMRTPPMGWLAWERFRCNVDCDNDPKNCMSEKLFVDMADRITQDGWKEAGYVYVNIDDCWASMERDEKGRLQPDPKRFSGGILKLAHYMHNKGLKLGIYGNMGRKTCEGYPGTTLDTIKIDAETFAEWEVDMLKLDGCYSNPEEHNRGYPLMAKALNATGRPIAYSCSWPFYQDGLPPRVNYTLVGENCNLWRNYYDIRISWGSINYITEWFAEHQDVLIPAAGPGRWNDPDMLVIGNPGLSTDQAQAQMALWSIMAAPLLMSNDLRDISSEARSILQNKMAIGINQDPLGIQGRRIIKDDGGIDVFWRPLSNKASGLVFLNRQDMSKDYKTSLMNLKYNTTGSYNITDVFTEKTMMLTVSMDFVVSVKATSVVMWHVSAPTETLSKS